MNHLFAQEHLSFHPGTYKMFIDTVYMTLENNHAICYTSRPYIATTVTGFTPWSTETMQAFITKTTVPPTNEAVIQIPRYTCRQSTPSILRFQIFPDLIMLAKFSPKWG